MVQPILEPIGFIKSKEGEDTVFFKPTNYGYKKVPLLIWEYGDLYYISLSFLIRINELNKVFLPYSTFVVKENDESMTLGATIESFGYEGDHKVKVENIEDLGNASKIFNKILKEGAIPFFSKYTSVKSVDEELNRYNRPRDLFCNEITGRPVIGITAAALNHNPEFSFWEDYYRGVLNKSPKIFQDKYEKLVVYLKDNYMHNR